MKLHYFLVFAGLPVFNGFSTSRTIRMACTQVLVAVLCMLDC